MSFHSLNSRAKDAAVAYKKVLGPDGISVHNVDDAMNAFLRQETLEDAKRSNRSIITNCSLLGEGVNEPGWDLVVMVDCTTSPVDSRQRIGRVNQKAPGKECGYVLIPMPLMDVGFVIPDYNNNDNDDDDDDNDHGVRGNTTRNSSVGYKNFVTVFQAMVGEDPKFK